MTYQRPVYEQVTLAHGGNTVTLRPSLRAAVTLEARYGFPAMFRALEEGSFTVISDIITTAANCGDDAAAFLRSEAAGRSLSSFIGLARISLAELVSMFRPAPDPTAADIRPSGKSVMLSEFYADLYENATGWLGWTPEQAWNATPTEICRALRGQTEHLIFTGILKRDDKPTDKPTDKAPDPDQAARNVAAGLDPDFDRAGLRALKAKIAGGNA
jgi:hypothetical protein